MSYLYLADYLEERRVVRRRAHLPEIDTSPSPQRLATLCAGKRKALSPRDKITNLLVLLEHRNSPWTVSGVCLYTSDSRQWLRSG